MVAVTVASAMGILPSVAQQFAGYSGITGNVGKYGMDKVWLYRTVDGRMHEIGFGEVDGDGSYGFLFKAPAEGAYFLVGDKDRKYRVWLHAGESASLDILEESAVLGADNTQANKVLYEWESMVGEIRQYGVFANDERILFDHTKYFPLLGEFVVRAQRFKKDMKIDNPRFRPVMERTIGYDTDFWALCYLWQPRINPATKQQDIVTPADYSAFYLGMVTPEKFTGPEVLEQPYGIDLLRRYAILGNWINKEELVLANWLKYTPNDQLKAELVLEDAKGFKSYEEFIVMSDTYGHLFTDRHTERLRDLWSLLYKPENGGPASDFTYPDRDGNGVSLSDFRGSVVLIDVWATWCGPCMAEVPHLKELERQMHGTGVVFLSVSVDEAKNRDKWLETLDKEELGGIQLHASGWSRIAKDYGIKGIPRFMVVGRDGRMVSKDAPRPSNPALKMMLENALKAPAPPTAQQ